MARQVGQLHRDAITAVDKLTATSAPSVMADQATGGSLLENTAYRGAYAAANRWGTTPGSATITTTTANDAANTHALRLTLAQITGATHYDIFMSVDAAPKWVARVTEAERAAGVTVTAVGTVDPTSPGAGKVDVRVPGTGSASTANPFIANTAYLPASVTSVGVTTGYSIAKILVKLAVTDLRSLPTLKLAIFSQNQASTDDWHLLSLQTVSLLTAVGEPLEQEFRINLDHASGLVVLVDTISGQGAACSVWVEPLDVG